MNILVTGAAGFVGKNLVASLENIRDQKDRTRGSLQIDEIYAYDKNTDPALLKEYCRQADFVFHLAGVNRPKNEEEFMQGNYGFSSELLKTLQDVGNTCTIMLASSIQATLLGRYEGSAYGESKRAGEELFFEYGKETGARVLVYRFPNLFGKWCRPNYNSAVATFCYNIARDLPIQVNDPKVELELLYIDDLIEEMLCALQGQEHHCDYEELMPLPADTGRYCYVPITHKVTLGRIVELLQQFHDQKDAIFIPHIPGNSFEKKLFSTYVSYLPQERMKHTLRMNCDDRGSFTEMIHTTDCGQFSVNVSKPGITKGQHWHHSKWEYFMVVSGRGLIQERQTGVDENGNPYPVIEFEVSGEKMEAIYMLPGYTHNIINLSDSENLVTVMWANEAFDPSHPDTFYEPVEE